jgi:hypothetical protein
MFQRIAILALLLLLPLSAARIKLYMKGGGDLIVTEYRIEEDRVHYYSTERSQWEVIPLELIDLERTREEEQKAAAWREEREAENRAIRQEERRARTELHNVPLEDGVYFLDGDKVTPVQQSDVVLDGSKKRTFLQVIAPIPVLPGKTTVDLEGEKSKFVVVDPRPMFYVRLEKISRMGVLRMRDKKDGRRAQVIETLKVTGESFEEQDDVELFRQQLAPSVYKVWPVEPLAPGEYAVYDYTPGEANIRIWDFSYRGGAAAPAP